MRTDGAAPRRRWGWSLAPALALTMGCADYRFHLPPDAGEVDAGVAVDAGVPDAGDDSDFVGDVCADIGRKVVLVPLDLLVLLDVSGSMDFDFKWLAVKTALESFVGRTDLAGLDMGLQYFPQRAACRVDAYQTPTVPIAPLAGQAAAIITSLDLQRMSGGTPTVPALQGSIDALQATLAAFPDGGHRGAIVLATDGMPDTSCAGVDLTDGGTLPNSISNVALVAGLAAQGSPAVKTFVIGVGTELGALDEVADAGGTGNAVLVDVAGNADVQFLSALTRIRHDALGCDFAVPPPSVGVDLTKARIRFIPDNGGPVVRVPRRADYSACGDQQGWYFDDALAPTKVVLCNATCDTITGGNTGTFQAEFACGVN